ncbi:MAG: tripartite tricarboxylate transporter permease, partial [Candidatus Woesearchaeota archaeon]
RNGSIVAVQQLLTIDKSSLAVLVLSSIVAGGIALVLTLSIAKAFARWITKIDNAKVSAIVICFVASLVMLITGSLGLLVLAVSTAIGLVSATAGISRTHSMGCILLPVIIYYL